MSEKQFACKLYLMVHKAIKKHIADFESQIYSLTTLSQTDVIKSRQWYDFYWEMVEGHHIAEDTQAFPGVASRDPQFGQAAIRLTADHHDIDKITAEIYTVLNIAEYTSNQAEREFTFQKFKELISRFNVVMTDHLTREEAIYVPSMAEHFTVQEQMAIEDAVLENMPAEHLAMMLPWIMEGLAANDRADCYAELSETFRKLYDTSWKQQYIQATAGFRMELAKAS